MVEFIRFFVVGLSLVSSCAYASMNCFNPSPRFVGDAYWNIVPLKIVPAVPKQEFLAQSRALSGRVVGSLVKDECIGSESKSLLKTTKASVKGQVSVSQDGVKLSLEITNLNDKTIKTELLEFLGHSSMVDFTSQGNGHFTVQQKMRANANPSDKISLLRESDYSISFAKNKLSIHAVHYANGIFYAEDTWVLSPR